MNIIQALVLAVSIGQAQPAMEATQQIPTTTLPAISYMQTIQDAPVFAALTEAQKQADPNLAYLLHKKRNSMYVAYNLGASFPKIETNAFTLPEGFSGHLVIFGAYCPDCQREIKSLKAQDVDLNGWYFISVDKDLSVTQKWLNTNSIAIKNLAFDPERKIFKQLKATAIPSMYEVTQGRIQHIVVEP